jgi:hypothetical protein
MLFALYKTNDFCQEAIGTKTYLRVKWIHMEPEKSMENPTLDLIHRHASVRRYKADPLPASVIEAIIAAGQRASTSSNLQTYSVVAVIDPAKRAKLSELCGNQKHVAEAPV